MYVAAIDVGITNVGFALLKNTKIVYADKLQLYHRGKGKGKLKEAEVIERVNHLFFSVKLKKYIDMAEIVLIENQMTRLNLIIQHVIGALMYKYGKPIKFVRPHDVKRQFDISTLSHKTNKRAAIVCASKLYPVFFDLLDESKQDDVADSVLMARYYVEKNILKIPPRKTVKKTTATKKKKKRTSKEILSSKRK